MKDFVEIKSVRRVLAVFGNLELIENRSVGWGSTFEIVKHAEINGVMYHPVQHSGFSKSYIKKCWKNLTNKGN